MNEWWTALDGFEKTLWTITLVATVIFVIQTVATFIGMDSDGGLDADFSGDMDVDADGGGDGHDHSPFQLFTFRNFINFFLGFGWSVITLEDKLGSRTIAVIIGVIVGALLVATVMYMFYSLSKLAESGNMELKNAVNKTAQVYLPIPANKTGVGKIQVQIQGSLHELDAITDGDALPTGTMTRVKEIMDNKFVLVEKI
jgi:hypothetical protein